MRDFTTGAPVNKSSKQYAKIKEFKESVPNLGNKDISGQYEGLLIKYDWSGKHIIGQSKISLFLKKENDRITGLWVENDTTDIGECVPWGNNGDGGDNGGDEDPEPDCNGDLGGSAYNSDCGCIGGNTGIYECPPDEDDPEEPEDPNEPVADCAGVIGGSAYVNTECNTCMGGTTGITVCTLDPCDTYNYNNNEIDPLEISAMALASGLMYPELIDIADAARQGTLNTTWNGVVNATVDRNLIGSVAEDLQNIGNLKGVGILNLAGKVIGIAGAIQSVSSAYTQYQTIDTICLRSWIDMSISIGSVFIKSNVVGFGVSAGWLILKETL